MKVKSVKTNTHIMTDYTETVDFKVLMCSNIDGNNNKFYVIELQKNSHGGWRLFSHYGRLDKSNVYEVRDYGTDQHAAIKEMESIVKKKCRSKKKTRGDEVYYEKYEVVDVTKCSIGSSNIREVENTISTKSSNVNIDTSGLNDIVADTIRHVSRANVHAIQNVTSLTVTDDGLKTPVGYLSKNQIELARDVLNDINSQIDNKTGDFKCEDSHLTDLNVKFFSLIPHPFGSKIDRSDCIYSPTKLEEKFELLDQLDAALTVTDNRKSKSSSGINIELETDKKVIERLRLKALDTRAHNHRNLNSWGWDVDEVFKVNIPKERERYEQTLKSKKYPKDYVIEVWHGSRSSNILSILLGGLIIPPSNASHVCGRAFGNGVYGATSSTKSLNYSLGFWGGGSINEDIAYLLVCDFNMGNAYECRKATFGNPPSGYHSTYAMAGGSLYNDELIVYNLDQVTIKYLLKMKRQ